MRSKLGIYSTSFVQRHRVTWTQLMSSCTLNRNPLITARVGRTGFRILLKSLSAIFQIKYVQNRLWIFFLPFHWWPNVSFISHPYLTLVVVVLLLLQLFFFSTLESQSHFYSPRNRWYKLRQWWMKAFGHKISFDCEHCVSHAKFTTICALAQIAMCSSRFDAWMANVPGLNSECESNVHRGRMMTVSGMTETNNLQHTAVIVQFKSTMQQNIVTRIEKQTNCFGVENLQHIQICSNFDASCNSEWWERINRNRENVFSVAKIYDADFPWKFAKTVYNLFFYGQFETSCFCYPATVQANERYSNACCYRMNATNKEQQWQWQLKKRIAHKIHCS